MDTLANRLGRTHCDSHRQLCAVARRYAGPDAAEDIVQDAYLRALKHAERFRGEASPTTWLHRMVLNACIDEWRRRRNRGVTNNRHPGGVAQPEIAARLGIPLGTSKTRLVRARRRLRAALNATPSSAPWVEQVERDTAHG